jgi:large subunit ribosomal protein L28
MKAGSFDNYLLTTKPEVIDSRFGLYLRGLIKRKQADPTCEVPYIP